MYNPDTLITSKEEKMELSPSPVFYEDDYPYPWKPFKSNGGTGDAPADWLQPSSTAEPKSPPTKPKLCPFRKRTYGMAGENGDTWNVSLNTAEFTEEEFLPCLREQCAVWNEKGQVCCY